jgi:hypothetical protein
MNKSPDPNYGRVHDELTNADPVTGAPGSHPAGAGTGAATGGIVGGVTGAAAGGPVGAAIGVVAGGIAGAYAGKEVAEGVNPTVEEEYWRNEYPQREYYDARFDYERDVAPAYRYGREARLRYIQLRWNDVESRLKDEWPASRDSSSLDWDPAMPAIRDAWDREDMPRMGDLPNDDNTTPRNRPR